MKFKVIKGHKNDNSKAIKVNKGEVVNVIKEAIEADGWLNWIYCSTIDKKSEEWVPKQILEIKECEGIILESYSAVELNVERGEIVEGEQKLNGWIWCIKEKGECGWIPLENLEEYLYG